MKPESCDRAPYPGKIYIARDKNDVDAHLMGSNAR